MVVSTPWIGAASKSLWLSGMLTTISPRSGPLSMLTASLAALLVEEDDEGEMSEIRAQPDRIEHALNTRRTSAD